MVSHDIAKTFLSQYIDTWNVKIQKKKWYLMVSLSLLVLKVFLNYISKLRIEHTIKNWYLIMSLSLLLLLSF